MVVLLAMEQKCLVRYCCYNTYDGDTALNKSIGATCKEAQDTQAQMMDDFWLVHLFASYMH